MMTVELCLIRHGQTDWNLEGRYQGHADIPLNRTGLEQAYSLADRLDGEKFDALFCSDLLRARTTAGIIAERLGLKLQLDRRLREIDQGKWSGRRINEVIASCQDGFDPIQMCPPGGETVAEVALRMAEAAGDIAASYPNRRVLLVSHGLAVAALICLAKGIPLEKVYDHIPANATPQVICWG